jgi:RHS repeat-associated protein
MIFDQSGTLANTKRHDYLPFGEELFAGTGGRTTAQGYGSNDRIRQQFTQKERDNETGLDYFGYRYYANTQGRFTSVDPENYQAMGDLSDPQSWNAYSYVNNNPLRRVDPDGRGFWEKLKNAVLWGCACSNAELEDRRKADEQQRRQELQQYSQSQGLNGHVIVNGKDGKPQAVSIDSLNRSQVVQISQTVRYLQAGINVEGVGTISHNDALSLIGALGNVPQRARNTLEHIEKTGEPPPGYRGGRRFLNDGRVEARFYLKQTLLVIG